MAEHIVVVTPAESQPFIPSLIEGENFNDEWIVYTRPNSQDTITPDSVFAVKFNRPIDTSVVSLDNFKVYRITDDSPIEIDEVEDAFGAINWTDHYDSLSRQLLLILSDTLPSGAQFFFEISGLTDTTGAVQTEDHIVLFATSGEGTEYDADTQYDIDQVIIEDYTLVTPPAPAGGGTYTTIVGCNIPDGTLNVVSTTDTITLTYTEEIDTSAISVTEESLVTGETTTLSIEVEQDEEFVVTITLPNQSTDSPADPDGPYVNENCIYTIDAIYTAFQFTGTLNPYYVPLNAFIPYTTAPLADPITWARLVYLTSKEIEARMADNAEWLVVHRAEELRNFTKYLILAMTSGVSSNESFMLGELQISAGMSITNRGNVDFASMMDLWESKLFGYGLTVRSVDVMAPRADTYYPRSPVARRWAERRYGTFDRRIL